jgi:enterochelin esterase-like enzyme
MTARIGLITALAGVLAGVGAAQEAAAQQRGTVEHVKIHAKSLEGNLNGDPAERDVSVYLPASYKVQRDRRYPVVYMLHGFTDSNTKWFGVEKHWINLPEVLDKAMAGAPEREMIIVMPNAFTRFHGSMYSTSATNGDWETFVARELVAFIDAKYRTLPATASRGLAGHSMGGYGTIRIGMKYPEVFSSVYALSPCCLMPSAAMLSGKPTMPPQSVEIKTQAEIDKASFGVKAALASAAAWSPNPKNPPLFIDLPVRDGQTQPAVVAKWAANAPLAMMDQYLPNLKRLKAIAFDAGNKDAGIAAAITVLDKALNGYDVPHFFEIYNGDHLNRIADRIAEKMLPFFGENLSFSDGLN